MSGKLSEYKECMSKYTSWNVMVGITWSKVIFMVSILNPLQPRWSVWGTVSAGKWAAGATRKRRWRIWRRFIWRSWTEQCRTGPPLKPVVQHAEGLLYFGGVILHVHASSFFCTVPEEPAHLKQAFALFLCSGTWRGTLYDCTRIWWRTILFVLFAIGKRSHTERYNVNSSCMFQRSSSSLPGSMVPNTLRLGIPVISLETV